MKRLFFLLATLFTLCINWTSCSDGGDEANGNNGNGNGTGGGNSSSITLSKNELEFDSNDGYQTIKITSNGEWEVTGGSDWCDISPSKGKTGENVTISVEANTTDKDRTITYTFKCGNQTANLTVLQYGIIETSYVDLKIEDEGTSVEYNEQTGKAILEYKNGSTPNAEIGQAFVLSGEYDYDIRKITGVTQSNGKLTLQTEQGNMCDLFKNVSFTLTTNPDMVATSRSAGRVITPTSIEIIKGNKRTVLFDKSTLSSRDVYEAPIKIFDFKQDFSGMSLFLKEDNISEEFKWETWKANIGLDAVFHFDFGEKTTNKTKIGELKNFKYYLQGNVDIDLLLALEATIEAFSFSVPEEKQTLKKDVLPMLTVRFMAGPVPVVITLETDLKREGEISCAGSIQTSVGFKFNADAKLGMEYDVRTREAQPITEFTPQFELHKPTLNIQGSLEASAGYYPHLQFHFYKFLGPYLDIKPLYTAEIKAGMHYDYINNESLFGWCADFGTKINGEFGLELDWGLDEAKLKFFDEELKKETLFKAPAHIELESPENGHSMEISEEVEVCFHVQAKNCLTGDLYDCPGALVQFGTEEFIERSVASEDLAIADKEGKVRVKWKPEKDSDYLRAMINTPDGELIDEAKFNPEIKDIRRTILEMIYKQTDGNNWVNNENWMSEKPLHHWHGVSIGLKDTLWINLNENNLKGFIDLSTIEGFDKSEYPKNVRLSVGNNHLTSINVSGHDIRSIDFDCNPLDSLDTSACLALEDLHFHQDIDNTRKALSYLNVQNSGLKSLYCGGLHLTTLLINGCSALERLYCLDNQLKTLNLSGCTALKELSCSNNQLTSIELSGCNELERLDCGNNLLTSLNISAHSSLQDLNCSDNPIESLDISGHKALTFLSVGNKLKSLNASNCSALIDLYLWNGQLSNLNVSNCTSLIDLDCRSNQLTNLNVNGCSSLKYLYCDDNKISSVIPSWFSQLSVFSHDQRYTGYYWQDKYFDGNWIGRDLHYTDNGVGWWYPGEPDKGYHDPN